jgi:hypothetical protein
METQLSQSEMAEKVFTIINRSGWFTEVSKETDREGPLVDILAQRNVNGNKSTWAFEIISRKMVDIDVIHRLGTIKTILNNSYANLRMILISNGELTSRASEGAKNLGIDVLPFNQLENELTKLATLGQPSLFNPIELKANNLPNLLDKVPLGTPGWMEYQKLCSDIFEYLFCPPLDKPLFENADASRRNRRDMIFPNNAEEGFWFNLRNTYDAHYIVVDAKNYARPLQKKPVLDIAHYLKPYGCGLFGILFSRKGPGRATIYAVQQEWISGRKMILALSDNDFREMILLKASNNLAEEWLKRKISEFRIAL